MKNSCNSGPDQAGRTACARPPALRKSGRCPPAPTGTVSTEQQSARRTRGGTRCRRYSLTRFIHWGDYLGRGRVEGPMLIRLHSVKGIYRAALVSTAVFIGGCHTAVLSARGADRRSRTHHSPGLPDDHVDDRSADDRGHYRVCMVVPRRQHARSLSADVGVLRPARTHRVVDPGAGDPVPRRYRLARLPRSGSGPSPGLGQTAPGDTGGVVRLEVVVHLSVSGRRQHQSDRRACRRGRCISVSPRPVS